MANKAFLVVHRNLVGLRGFLLRDNLIEVAIAVIMGTTFGAVVNAFTDLLLDVIGKFLGTPNFSQVGVAGISLGAFLSALFTFILTGLVIYFFVMIPYNKIAAVTKQREIEVIATTEDLLAEIRDLLKAQAEKQ